MPSKMKEGADVSRELRPEAEQRSHIDTLALDKILLSLEAALGLEVVDDPARREFLIAQAEADRQSALTTHAATPDMLAQDRQGEYDYTRTVPFTLDMTGIGHPDQPPVMPAALMGQAPMIGE